jgi:hypothetical protein
LTVYPTEEVDSIFIQDFQWVNNLKLVYYNNNDNLSGLDVFLYKHVNWLVMCKGNSSEYMYVYQNHQIHDFTDNFKQKKF